MNLVRILEILSNGVNVCGRADAAGFHFPDTSHTEGPGIQDLH